MFWLNLKGSCISLYVYAKLMIHEMSSCQMTIISVFFLFFPAFIIPLSLCVREANMCEWISRYRKKKIADYGNETNDFPKMATFGTSWSI